MGNQWKHFKVLSLITIQPADVELIILQSISVFPMIGNNAKMVHAFGKMFWLCSDRGYLALLYRLLHK